MNSFRQFFAQHGRSIIILAAIVLVAFFAWRHFTAPAQAAPYQTAAAQTGSLVMSVSASGVVTAGNSVDITTQASGLVNNVYVKNGDTVVQGQRIADLTLDQDSQQRLAAANSSYQNAVSNEQQAENNKAGDDATLWKDRQSVLTAQNNEDLKNQGVNQSANQTNTNLDDQVIDSALIQANKQFNVDQQTLNNADQSITAAKASESSAAIAVEEISPTVVAPVTGTVSNLTLVPGLVVTNTTSSGSSSSSSSSVTAQSFGMVTLPGGQTQATVNLSEIDAVNVQQGQQVTMTLDAFPNKTFTGKVLAINTNGTVSSNVTTYPATISFDTSEPNIYPNMAVTAKIITNVENDVLLVPSAAVSSAGGNTTVRVLKNGKPQTVSVQTGDSNDTETVITSGLSEGDMVITGGGPTAPQTTSSGGTSPFGAIGGNRGFGGGGGGTIIRGGGGGRGG